MELTPPPGSCHGEQRHAAETRPVNGPDVPVAIVGGGPVGMTAALVLARHGLRSLVLESEPRLLAQGSRSICV
ncbi:MAG TPA: FAD-dependent monooxygenase, partial [Actinomycetes bacterium]